MDTIDRAIVRELQGNARLTNAELAQRVGLTPAPCLRRVRRLEEDGVLLGYHAEVNPDRVGRAFKVLIDVDLTSQAHATVEAFESQAVELDEDDLAYKQKLAAGAYRPTPRYPTPTAQQAARGHHKNRGKNRVADTTQRRSSVRT